MRIHAESLRWAIDGRIAVAVRRGDLALALLRSHRLDTNQAIHTISIRVATFGLKRDTYARLTWIRANVPTRTDASTNAYLSVLAIVVDPATARRRLFQAIAS